MSKVGKKPITIPNGVDIKIEGGFISAKGPKGTLKKSLPERVTVTVNDKQLSIQPESSNREARMFWGLARSLVQNMVTGVSEGYEKTLEFQGVGYKASVKGNDLELGLGFSHPVTVQGAEGITFKTEKNTIKIIGADKELVGKIAAKIRSYREPEPYKGHGIHYMGEVIQRKAGKKAAAAG